MIMEKDLNVIASGFINACYSAGREEFLKQMRQLHRTEQQMLVGLVFGWLNDFVDYPTDDRNRASVGFCRELHKLYCDYTGREDFRDRFPLI